MDWKEGLLATLLMIVIVAVAWIHLSQVRARCRDGFLSRSRHRQGTCSGHGGVAEWLPA